jgi:hypothetical protein
MATTEPVILHDDLGDRYIVVLLTGSMSYMAVKESDWLTNLGGVVQMRVLNSSAISEETFTGATPASRGFIPDERLERWAKVSGLHLAPTVPTKSETLKKKLVFRKKGKSSELFVIRFQKTGVTPYLVSCNLLRDKGMHAEGLSVHSGQLYLCSLRSIHSKLSPAYT